MKATDFTSDAPIDMIQHVIDNVDDFEGRYKEALYIMGRERVPLYRADYALKSEIDDAIDDWCYDNDDNPDFYDSNEIFG